jgi:lupus La protein
MLSKRRATSQKKTAAQSEKPAVFLEFTGEKVRVHEDAEGAGFAKEEEVPEPLSGSMLKFSGCDGSVKF